MKRPPDDPFVLATEHLAWCLRDGMTFSDILSAIGEPCFGTETGYDILWAIAKAAEELKDPRLVARAVKIYPPFKRRESPSQRVPPAARRVA